LLRRTTQLLRAYIQSVCGRALELVQISMVETFLYVIIACMVHAGCMVFNKLLALLKRKRRKPLTCMITPATPDFIIVLPSEQPQCANEPGNCEQMTKADDEERCEEPAPYQIFHAVDVEAAREKAAKKGLLILFKEHERWDLFGRRNVYWAITPEFALKLLRLQKDIKSQDEFTPTEQAVLKDLALKGWVKVLKNGGTYYYGLHPKTTVIIKKQLSQTF